MAAAWILLSDRAMHVLWPESESLYEVGRFKGLAFVCVTALILYWLLRSIQLLEVSRYLTMFENHHAVMMIIDPASGKIVDANPAAAEFYGWHRDRMRGMHLTDINTLPTAEIEKELALAEKGERSLFYYRHRLANGDIRDVEISSGPTIYGGRPLLLSIVQDVTARKESEEKLQRSEAHYRELFESNPYPMWVFDLDTLAFLAVNDAAILHYGYSREEFLAMTIKDIRPPEEVSRLQQQIKQMVPGASASGTWRHRKKNGEIIVVEISRHTLAFSGRNAAMVLANDITDRMRALQALEEEEEKFRALTEQSMAGIYMIDNARFSYVNPRAAEIFGYGVEEVMGHNVRDFIEESDWPQLEENMRQRLSGEVASAQYEIRAVRKDGSKAIVGIHGTRATLGGKRIIIGMLQDITEKRRAENTIQYYTARLEHAVRGSVDAISLMVEMRDPYTAGHERRVGELAAAIAAEMGLDDDAQRGLRIAGAVHDVGKMVVPAEILCKPSRLTATEYELIKVHAQQGYEVLKGIDFPWPVAEIAYQHHERMDGSGYPRGLKGEEIYKEARIMAVADVVESMTTHRPYRPALGISKALEEVERNAGKFYDPTVADACLRLFREKNYNLPK